MDRPSWVRPFRAPSWLLAMAAAFGFANMFFIGMGAPSYGKGVLLSGLVATACIVPIFLYRHCVTDRGAFPALLHEEEHPFGDARAVLGRPVLARAGMLPYLALAGAVIAVALGNLLAVT